MTHMAPATMSLLGDKTASKLSFFPESASSFSGESDWVFWFISIVCILFFIPISVALFGFAWKYKKGKGEKAESQIDHNTTLELVWSIGPSFLLVVMFYFGGLRPSIVRLGAWSTAAGISVIAMFFLGIIPHEDFRPYATKVIREYQYDGTDTEKDHRKYGEIDQKHNDKEFDCCDDGFHQGQRYAWSVQWVVPILDTCRDIVQI